MTNTETIRFDFELDIEHELEVDQDGILTISCFTYTPIDEDDANVVAVPFGELLDSAIETCRDDLGYEGYSSLYTMGHALSEASKRVLKAAELQEDYVNGKDHLMRFFEGDGDAV
jgi:hypothetical protein